MAVKIFKQEIDDYVFMCKLAGKYTDLGEREDTENMQEKCKVFLAELSTVWIKEEKEAKKVKPSALEKANAKEQVKKDEEMKKKMAEFAHAKEKVPPPTVRHNEGKNFKNDINVPLNIIVGGNHLIEDTDLQLVQGMKYGLIGRNGIGKTCLIDAISSADIEGFPQNIHTLQVE